MKEKFSLYNNGATEMLFGVESSHDLMVTSPPFKEEDGYSDRLMELVFNLAYWRLRPGALLFVNMGHLKAFKDRPFKVQEIIQNQGFKLLDTILWLKCDKFGVFDSEKMGRFSPLNGNNLDNLYEFVFMFSRGNPDPLDRLSIGVPFKDKANIERRGHSQDLRCAGNVWHIPYDDNQKKLHPDRFPVELPTRCIKLSGIKPGSLVCDPFNGSGTTGLVALRLGMRYQGSEILRVHCETTINRIQEETGECYPIKSIT